MNSIHNTLTSLFALIGFSFGESNETAGVWWYRQIKQTESINYTAYELIIGTKYASVTDFMAFYNPSFKAEIQDNGFHISEATYSESGNNADIRLYIEIDSEIN